MSDITKSDKKFTLDGIREAAKKKYADFEIELSDGTTAVLVNALRLSEEKRTALQNTQREMQADEDDDDTERRPQVELLKDSIRLICQTGKQAETLIEEIGDDLPVLATIFETYAENTQAGEA